MAAAALIISARTIKKVNAWNSEMEKWSGYKERELKETVEDLK